MAPLRTYLLPAMAAVAAVRAANIADYVPGCAPECIYEAVEEHSTCDKADSACICRDIYSLKTHSEDCLEEKCSDSQFGEAMLGYDNFCKELDSGEPAPTTTGGGEEPAPEPTSTSVPPPPETTAEPPPEDTATEEPPTSETSTAPGIPELPSSEPSSEPTGEPTSEVPAPTSDSPAPTTSADNTPVPTPTSGEPTTSGGSGGGGDGGDGGDGGSGGEEPSATETPPPEDAGAQLSSSFSAMVGGALLAAFFGL